VLRRHQRGVKGALPSACNTPVARSRNHCRRSVVNTRETATELLCAALEGGMIRLREPGAAVDVRADARAIAQAWRTLAKALRKGELKADDEDPVRLPPRAAKAAAAARARKR
jgi:hypothetical protein